MKTILLGILMITGLCSAAFAADQNNIQNKQQVIQLAGVIHQCTKSSDCGPYGHCCSTSQGKRCYPTTTVCPR